MAAQIEYIDDELQNYGLSTNDGYLGWVHEPVTIPLDTYREKLYDGDYLDVIASDFVVQADITWSSTSGYAGCGFLLRADLSPSSGSLYEFVIVRLSGLPLWGIQYFNHGERQYILGDTDRLMPNDRIDDGQNSTNRVTVAVIGDKLTTYVNGVKLGSVRDSQLTEGMVAFMGWQESGETTCEFSNAWLWIYD